MNPRELVEAALRVLVAWNKGRKPASADLDVLRKTYPRSAHLPDDELACQIIHHLNRTACPESARNS
jgi:hypothetical protein